MKIGQLVKSHIKKILHYCDTVDHDELPRLTDTKYSKKTFDIDFPFCTEISQIPSDKSKRYWTTSYLVRGKTVRVSSQWFDKSTNKFSQYVIKLGIISKEDLLAQIELDAFSDNPVNINTRRSSMNSRFKGHAIGNAQNLIVRNILSNLGQESFTQKDWLETKEYFSGQCAYCGTEGDLVIEHAIPINRKSWGSRPRSCG